MRDVSKQIFFPLQNRNIYTQLGNLILREKCYNFFMKKICCVTLLFFSFVGLCFALVSCSYGQILKNANGYVNSGEDLEFSYYIDTERAAEIRKYFTENTELNLEEINSSSDSTWDKTVKIATFVSENIAHANQKVQPESGDCITLWEYHKNIEEKFNCRFHSMMMNELLLSVGVLNRYVWCMPKNSKDPDCHVVNNVWIPEWNKWVMVDTDQRYYVCDKNGTVLSISEIREKLIGGESLKCSTFAKVSQSTSSYLDYLSKDFYWFTVNQKVRFISNKNTDSNNFVNLLPKGFKGFNLGDDEIITNDAEAFWKKPEESEIL